MKTFKYLIAALALALFSPFAAVAGEGCFAEIDGTQYSTLAAAIEAASEGQTVKLIADTKENVTIDKNLTLDLNGCTLNGGTVKATPTLTVTANVTVKDSSAEQTGTIKREDTADNSNVSSYSAYYVIDIQGENAALTFESGNVVNNSGTTEGVRQGASLVRVGNDKYSNVKPTLIIKGGKFEQNNFPAIKVDYGTFTLEGGTITCANDEAVKNWADAFIKGGKITGTVGSWTCADSVCSSTLEISGGEIDGNVYAMMYEKEGVTKTATINITGGTITGNLGTYQGTSVREDATTPVDESTATIAVSGGTFDNAVDAKYCAPGYQPTEIETGKYGVADAIQLVTAAGATTTYHSLKEAFAAAQSGDTVKLLANLTETDERGGYIVYNMAGVTFDLNEHTYTQYNGAHAFLGTGGVITNGKIVCAPDPESKNDMKNGHGSYALCIGDDRPGNETTSFTVKNVAMTGGVNICNATGVVLENLTVNGTQYYAVWTEEGSSVTIKSGDYWAGAYALLNGSATTTMTVEDGSFHTEGKPLVLNSGVVPSISGGAFDTPVDAKYCADGFCSVEISEGVYAVDDAIQVLNADGYVAKTYHSLTEASAAATDGQTIKLLADFANTDYTVDKVIDIKLAKGVTLDGNGNTLTGNIKVTVDAAGDVTIKNVNFKDIHNLQALSAKQIAQYGFSSTKVGTLSAVYAKKLAGKLTVAGCVFENCDWEALQIVPVEGAVVDLRNNIFKSTASTVVTEQLRHVHVEMYYSGPNCTGKAITLTMTDNQLYGAPLDSSCGIYSMSSTSELELSGNYFEKPNTASITLTDIGSDGKSVDVNRCELIYPARSEPTVDEDNLKSAAVVVKDIYLVTAYESLAGAISAATEGQTVKLIADTKENVTIDKNLTLDLNGFTLNGGTVKATPTLTVTANVTILDSSEKQTGTLKREDTAENSGVSSHYVIDIQGSDASLTFKSGNVINNSGTTGDTRKGASLVRVGNDSNKDAKPTLVIEGGTFKQDNFTAIKVDYAIFTFKGGTITCANDEAIKNWASTSIEGGTVNGTVASWVYNESICSSTLKISGGTINGNVYAMMYDDEGGNETSTVEITGGTVTGNLGTYKGTSIREGATTPVDESTATIAVSGGTFDNAVDAKYCASGYQPTQGIDGKYGVADAIQVLDTASGDIVNTYHSLTEASAAATDGQTIKLFTDFANTDYTVDKVIDIKLAKGVTLDGNKKTLSGNIKVTVDAAGGVTIMNVNFKDIHNAAVVSEDYKEYYGFSDTKVGMLSAIYAPNLSGKLSVLGCVFENCDWEAMQITPVENAVLDIRENIFRSTTSTVVTEQLRYVHIEMAYGDNFDCEGKNITLTMTDNQFFGSPLNCSSAVFCVGKDSTLNLTGNYYEYPDSASVVLSEINGTDINPENRNDLIYPARSVADKDVDDLSAVALVIKDECNATAHMSLADAISTATAGQTVKLLADTTEDVNITKNITLDLGGKKLTNTNGGKATLTIAKDVTATVKNGSIVGGTSYYTILNNGTTTFEDIIATAGNTDSSMLDNFGTLIINSGTYTGGLNVVKTEQDSVLNIKGGTFTLNFATNGYTGVIFSYGMTTITGGEFIQNSSATWGYQQVVLAGVAEGYESIITITGGSFTNNSAYPKKAKIFHGVGDASSANFEVSGGTFNQDFSQNFCSTGFYIVKKDGVYTTADAIQVIAADGATNTYHSLADAFAAARAQSGATVKLLADLTEKSAKNGAIPYVMTGVTFDLNSMKYTHYNYAHVFQGTGGTIKNGKIVCAGYDDGIYSKGAYALSIGYQEKDSVTKAETTSFTVQDVKVTGGINISHATGVVLTNLTVKATQDYAVWTEDGASVTINGGTYTAGVKAVFSGYSDASITVEDGTFLANSAALVDTSVEDGKSPVVPSISGGTFDKEVAQEYCKEGYCCEKNSYDAYYSVLKSWDSALDEETLAVFSYSGTYDGKEHSISLTKDDAAFEGIEGVEVVYKETEEGEYGDKNPSYAKAGTKTVYYRVSAPGYAKYENKATVEIKQKKLTKEMFSLTGIPENGYVYDETEKKPDVSCQDGQPSIIGPDDYSVAYTDNIEVGCATVTITGKNNYTGEVTLSFTIGKEITDVTFDAFGGKIGSKASVTLKQENRTYNNFPADPTREGYVFAGWYLKVSDDAPQATADGKCLALDDHTLYALWKVDSDVSTATLAYNENDDGTITITGFDPKPTSKVSLVIPDRIEGKPVTEIAEKAFIGSGNITSVTLPVFLQQIGRRAFHNATSLKVLNIPAVRDWEYPYESGSLTIGELAFASTLLGEVYLPEEVTEIEDKAFNACQKLATVTILGEPIVGEEVFYNAGLAESKSPTLRLDPDLAANEDYLSNLTANFGRANLPAAVRTDAVVESVAPNGISIASDESAEEPVVKLPVTIDLASTWGEVDTSKVCVEYSESLEGLTSKPNSLTKEEGLNVTPNEDGTFLISVPVTKEATSGFFRVKILK